MQEPSLRCPPHHLSLCPFSLSEQGSERGWCEGEAAGETAGEWGGWRGLPSLLTQTAGGLQPCPLPGVISCGAREKEQFLLARCLQKKPFPGTLSSIEGSTRCLQTSLGSLHLLPGSPGLICSQRTDTPNPWTWEEVTAPNELESSVTVTIQDIIRCSEAHENLEKKTFHLPTHLGSPCPARPLHPASFSPFVPPLLDLGHRRAGAFPQCHPRLLPRCPG